MRFVHRAVACCGPAALILLGAPAVARAQLPTARLSSSTAVSGANVSLQLTLPSAAPSAGIPIRLSSSAPAAAVFQASSTGALSTTIPAGQTTLVVGVRTLGVSTPTTVIFTVTTSVGSLRTSLTVNPASVAAVSVQPATAPGGVPRTGTITLDGLAPAVTGAVVTLGATDASLVTVPAAITVPPGARTVTFPVLAQPVATTTSTSLSARIGEGTAGKAAVSISPPRLRSLTLAPSRVLGGSAMTGMVQLDAAAPSTGIAVTFAASPSTGLLVPRDLVIAPGATQAPFMVTTTVVSSRVDAVLTATSTNAATPSSATASLSVLSLDVASVTLSALHVYGGDETDVTVRLSGIATSSQVIPLRVAQTAGVAQSPPFTLPPSVTVPAGSDRITTRFATQIVSAPAEFQIVAGTAATATGNNAKLGIHARPAVQSITVSPSPAVASRTVGVTVQLAWPASPVFSSTPVLPLTPVVLTSDSPLVPAGPALPVSHLQTQASTTLPVGTTITNSSATLSARSGASVRTATVSIVPPPMAVSSIQLAASSITSGSTTTGTLVLSRAADAAGVSVTLTSSSPAVTVPAVIQIPGGARQVSFNIATTASAVAESVTLAATAPNTVAATATIRVVRLTVASVVSSATAMYGGFTLAIRVALSEVAPATGAVVHLVSSLPGVSTVKGAPLPATITIPAGRASETIEVRVPSVAAVSDLVLRADVATSTSAVSGSAVASPVIQVVPSPGGLEVRRAFELTDVERFTGQMVVEVAVTTGVVVPANIASVLPPYRLVIESDRADVLRPDTVLFTPGTATYQRTLRVISPAADAVVTVRAVTPLDERSRITRTVTVAAPQLLAITASSTSVVGGDPLPLVARLTRVAGPGGARGVFTVQGLVHERTWAAGSDELRTTIPTQLAVGNSEQSLTGRVIPAATDGLTNSRSVPVNILGTAVVDLRNNGASTLLAGESTQLAAVLHNPVPTDGFRGVAFSSSDPALVINGVDRAVVMPPPGATSVSQVVQAAALGAFPPVTRLVTVSAQSVHATNTSARTQRIVVVPPPDLKSLTSSRNSVPGGSSLALSVSVTPYQINGQATLISIPIRIESSHPAVIPPVTATMRLDESVARASVITIRPSSTTKVTLSATVAGKTVSTSIVVTP